MKILIPARSGSKGMNKNMAIINDKPLIFYTIREALKVSREESIFVSSDSSEILDYVSTFNIKRYLGRFIID